jgi:hypothetical protein
MDLGRILHQLHQERSRLDAAIVSLERLLESTSRRGRPSLSLEALKKSVPSARKRRVKPIAEPQT